MQDTATVDATITTVFREERAQIVATLIAASGEWDLAEDCAQEAFVLALKSWPDTGIPRRPGAWLTTVARNRLIDRQRRAAIGAVKLRELAERLAVEVPGGQEIADEDIADDRLRLIFTCCHPALSFEARIALTLRIVTGLTTAEIARAFLVPESTMAQRLVRAKQKIRNTGLPYRVPPAELLPERTAAVLGVFYLLYNEGYTASAGAELMRPDLSMEAIRLCRLLIRLMPDQPEAQGLLALMLLQHARRDARVNDAGDLVTLDEQDRTRWDTAEIAEGVGLLETALGARRPGPYQIQAAIAACHATADAASTDWRQIAALYRELARWTPSAVIELNRAVAVGMSDGPGAGLRLVDGLSESGALADYYLLPATRADLLRRLGRVDEAAIAYREALALAPTDAERRYLDRRLAELSVDPGPG